MRFPRSRGERGAVTMLVIPMLGVLVLAALLLAFQGGVVISQRRAQAAADLAALAGAAALQQGHAACDSAADVAARNGARLRSCRVGGRERSGTAPQGRARGAEPVRPRGRPRGHRPRRPRGGAVEVTASRWFSPGSRRRWRPASVGLVPVVPVVPVVAVVPGVAVVGGRRGPGGRRRRLFALGRLVLVQLGGEASELLVLLAPLVGRPGAVAQQREAQDQEQQRHGTEQVDRQCAHGDVQEPTVEGHLLRARGEEADEQPCREQDQDEAENEHG